MDSRADAPLSFGISRLIESRKADQQHGWDIPVPRLRHGASVAAVDALETRAGFALPGDYRDFLLLSDGMDDFYFFSLRLLGTQDWPESPAIHHALGIRKGYDEADLFDELAIANSPEDLFPIAGGDGSDAIFLANPTGRIAPGPIIWLGHSDVSCFRSIADLFDWEADRVAYINAGKLLPFPSE
jgi:hypothetical protein